MSKALVNRSLTNIRTELDFLLENNVISQEFFNEFSNRLPQKWDPSTSTSFEERPQVQYMEVIYPFEPQQQDDLRLQVGDKVEIIETLSDSWFKGKCNGQIGIFPANYVKPAFSGSYTNSSDRPTVRPSMPLPPSGNMFMDLPEQSFGQQEQAPPYTPYSPPQQEQERQRLEKQRKQEEERKKKEKKEQHKREKEEKKRREEERRRQREEQERQRKEQEVQRLQQQLEQQKQQMQQQQQQQQQMQQQQMQQMQQQQQQMQQQQQQQHHHHGQGHQMLNQFGSRLGNAVIWGAGSRIGSDIVNSVFRKMNDDN